MASSILSPAGNYRSTATALTDTNATVVYTCPTSATAAFIAWINICDTSGGTGTATIQWVDSSASATWTIVNAKAIAANAAIDMELPIVLEPGDTLKVTADAATLHVIVTVLEVAGRKS